MHLITPYLRLIHAAFVRCASLICRTLRRRLIGSTPVCCGSSQCVRKLVVHYNILKMCSQKIPCSSLYTPNCNPPPPGLIQTFAGRGYTFIVCPPWMHVRDMEMKGDSKAPKHADLVRLCVDGSVNECRNTRVHTHSHTTHTTHTLTHTHITHTHSLTTHTHTHHSHTTPHTTHAHTHTHTPTTTHTRTHTHALTHTPHTPHTHTHTTPHTHTHTHTNTHTHSHHTHTHTHALTLTHTHTHLSTHTHTSHHHTHTHHTLSLTHTHSHSHSPLTHTHTHTTSSHTHTHTPSVCAGTGWSSSYEQTLLVMTKTLLQAQIK